MIYSLATATVTATSAIFIPLISDAEDLFTIVPGIETQSQMFLTCTTSDQTETHVAPSGGMSLDDTVFIRIDS